MGIIHASLLSADELPDKGDFFAEQGGWLFMFGATGVVAGCGTCCGANNRNNNWRLNPENAKKHIFEQSGKCVNQDYFWTGLIHFLALILIAAVVLTGPWWTDHWPALAGGFVVSMALLTAVLVCDFVFIKSYKQGLKQHRHNKSWEQRIIPAIENGTSSDLTSFKKRFTGIPPEIMKKMRARRQTLD